MTEQTVSEYLFSLASESLLDELADSNDYWQKVNTFVERNRDNKIKNLTPGQRSWLIKIKDDLIDEAAK